MICRSFSIRIFTLFRSAAFAIWPFTLCSHVNRQEMFKSALFSKNRRSVYVYLIAQCKGKANIIGYYKYYCARMYGGIDASYSAVDAFESPRAFVCFAVSLIHFDFFCKSQERWHLQKLVYAAYIFQ